MIVIVSCTHSTKRYDIPRHVFPLLPLACFHSLISGSRDVAIQADSEDFQCRLHGCDRRVSRDRPSSAHGSVRWFLRHRRFVQILSLRMKVV